MLAWAFRVLRSHFKSGVTRAIAFGVWVLVCIMLYDHLQPNMDSVLDMSDRVSNLFTYEYMPPPPVIHRPFDARQPKMAMILGYQRCGSTFAGNIFNQNPEAFYVFEPADSVYGAMYGAKPGFSVPSDIANYWNGTERAIPLIESQAVADTLSSLLSCDLDDVPTESLIHRFFYLFQPQQLRLNQYINCLRKLNLNIPNCLKTLKGVCPDRFGADSNKEEYCRRMLWERDGQGRHYEDGDVETYMKFEGYRHCMLQQRKQLMQCIPEIYEVCESSRLRTTKTVRVGMKAAELMFRQLSNFRVVHLIRDPRAVVLSRLGDPTYHGKFSGGSLVKEATLYCRGVLKDVQIRKQIEERFPGSVLQVIYEHLVANPIEQVRAIYSFLDEPLPEKVHGWLVKNTAGEVKNSTRIAEKWMDKMTFKMARSINEACSDLFDAIGYNWPSAT